MRDPAAFPQPFRAAARQRPVRVLLVEDDQLDRMALERHVLRQRLPYEIVAAESGADAMHKLRAGRFDVVLLDYMLGDMTGLELMPELRGSPAIFVTGLGNEEIAANAVRQGAYGFLVKDTERAYLQMLPLVISNVLERKQLEEALKESQRRLSTLLDTQTGMAYRSAAASNRPFEWVSQGCLELTGFGAAELAQPEGSSLGELIAPEDRGRVAAEVEAALQAGRALECTYRILTRQGLPKWVRERAVPVRGADGTLVAMEGYVEDISPRLQAEDRLRHAKENSDEAVRVKDQFVNLVVHDLRAPLSTCLLTVQQLRGEMRDFAEAHGIPDGTERRLRFASLFDGMTDRATDMLRMIDQLLLTSRIRSGRLVPAVRPVGKARIEAVVASLEALAQQKGVTLSCELPEGFRLLADPDLLAEVIQNLLTNAIKFTRAGGTVRVEMLAPEECGLSVKDTGVGIPAESLPLLLRHDRRYSTAGTAGEKGTGMGLAMCQEILAAHGGRLEVQSTPGKGSEFRVHLPPSLPRLMAVGVRPEDARIARAAVQALDGELVMAEACEQALDLAAQRMPQAVLLDGAAPTAASTLFALRADGQLRAVPVLWLGPAAPPSGEIPDERLASPLDTGALRKALRIPFGD